MVARKGHNAHEESFIPVLTESARASSDWALPNPSVALLNSSEFPLLLHPYPSKVYLAPLLRALSRKLSRMLSRMLSCTCLESVLH